MLTKDHAIKIAEKLGGQLNTRKKNRPHDLMKVFEKGKLIAHFGIRRGKKSLGHDHIPKDLRVSPHFCLQLADCTKSQEDWLNAIRNHNRQRLPAWTKRVSRFPFP